ncbi:unnamed protein product [Amoebophrya sp. A25]|nr:unnamed protein product [Amoebophrya sp. A25]|eukprot:GSA25T00009475001.1
MSSCSSSSWELDAMPPMDGVMPSSSSAEQGADQISESASSSSGERNRGRHLHVGRGNPGSLIKSKKRRSSNGGHQPEYIVGMGAQGGEQGQGVEAGTSFPGEVNRVEDANRPSGRAMKRPLGEDQGSRSRSRRRQSPEDDVEKARGHENSTDDPANHVGRLLGGSTPHGHMHEFAGQTAGADTITRRRCWNDAREEGMIAHARHSSSLDPAAPSSEVGMMYNLSTVKKGNVAPDFCSMFALTDSRWAPAKYEILSEGDDEHDLSTVKGCMSLMKHASGIYITVLFHMVITVGVLVSFRLAEKVTERRIFRNIVDETVVNLVTGIVAFALVFRINLAYARWWDSRRSCEDFAAKFFIASNLAFCFDQFTAASYRSKNTFRLRLASLYSLLHAEALKELGSMVELPCLGSRMLNQKQVQMSLGGPAGAFDANGRLPRGLQGRYSSDTIAHNVPATRNGVAQCYIWVVMLTSGRFSGAHHLSPPVIARLYSLLDEGIASYFDALVVRTTPFPYPFMQIINFGLFLIKIIVPVVVHQTGVALVWAIPLTCCCVFGFFGIGRVAEELEQPFGSDFYDHPLENWQIDFDLCLLDLVENQSFEVPRVDLPPLLTRDVMRQAHLQLQKT